MWKEKVKPSSFRKTSKELPWVNRNPRLFIILTTTFAMTIFFSKPIYDIFFEIPGPPRTQRLPMTVLGRKAD